MINCNVTGFTFIFRYFFGLKQTSLEIFGHLMTELLTVSLNESMKKTRDVNFQEFYFLILEYQFSGLVRYCNLTDLNAGCRKRLCDRNELIIPWERWNIMWMVRFCILSVCCLWSFWEHSARQGLSILELVVWLRYNYCTVVMSANVHTCSAGWQGCVLPGSKECAAGTRTCYKWSNVNKLSVAFFSMAKVFITKLRACFECSVLDLFCFYLRELNNCFQLDYSSFYARK